MTLTTADGIDEYIDIGNKTRTSLSVDFGYLIRDIRKEIGDVQYCKIETDE